MNARYLAFLYVGHNICTAFTAKKRRAMMSKTRTRARRTTRMTRAKGKKRKTPRMRLRGRR